MDKVQKAVENFCKENCIMNDKGECPEDACRMRAFAEWYYERGWVMVKDDETVEVKKEDLKDIASYVRAARNALEDEENGFDLKQTIGTLTDAHEWLYELYKEE